MVLVCPACGAQVRGRDRPQRSAPDRPDCRGCRHPQPGPVTRVAPDPYRSVRGAVPILWRGRVFDARRDGGWTLRRRWSIQSGSCWDWESWMMVSRSNRCPVSTFIMTRPSLTTGSRLFRLRCPTLLSPSRNLLLPNVQPVPALLISQSFLA